MPSGTAEGQAKSALLPSRSSSVAKPARRRRPQKCSQSARSARLNKPPTTRAKPLPKHRPTATQAATRSRSLLSRSRVSRAAEAARRVGGGLIVAAALTTYPSTATSKRKQNNDTLLLLFYNKQQTQKRVLYSAISLSPAPPPREPLLRDPLDVVGPPHRAASMHRVVVGRAVRAEGEEQQAVA